MNNRILEQLEFDKVRSDVPQDNRHRATPSRGPNGRARQGRTVQ